MANGDKKYNTVNITSDIVNLMSNQQNNAENEQAKSAATQAQGQDVELLRSIDNTLKSILGNSGSMSQSDARNKIPSPQYGPSTGYSNDSKWNNARKDDKSEKRHDDDDDDKKKKSRKKRSDGKKYTNLLDEFEEGLKEQLMESLFGCNLKDSLSKTITKFEKEFGVNLADVPKAMGKNLVKQVMADNELARAASNKAQSAKANLVGNVQAKMSAGIGKYDLQHGTDFKKQFESFFNTSQQQAKESKKVQEVGKEKNAEREAEKVTEEAAHQAKQEVPDSDKASSVGGSPDTADSVSQATGQMAQEAGEQLVGEAGTAAVGALAEGASMTEALASGMSTLLSSSILPFAAGLAAAYVGIQVLSWAFKGLGNDLKELGKSISASFFRSSEARTKRLENMEKRIEDDVETMVKKPFDILAEAAQDWYDTWDQNLRTINGTQGYSKDDLYDLMASYGDRLRSERLTSVVSSSDITENLAKVLEAGLSGEVAEEFAYLATVLNAAIPTQDFFEYGEIYASIAANAIKDGQSQSQAIATASAQLEQFASNVLYANRELSGGFSTGLKNASKLFESSVQIATASKTTDSSLVSGVLTSVAAIVGAIAPDLSDSIVDAVVNAAVGGNSSEIVALRSLAGINASNTEFLKALSTNPQAVFEELFSNLGKMQHMSDDAYMEVAEGVAGIFGLQKEALQRVDFEYLAQAISEMNVNNASLSENMKLLASGQTTTSEEQLKMQQINAYILENGLQYVMDNEAARSIQEHMWQEQIANELMEAEFAVNLRGSALNVLTTIVNGIDKLFHVFNPLGRLMGIASTVQTAHEEKEQRVDLERVITSQKVGTSGLGTVRDFYRLSTYGLEFHMTEELVDLLHDVKSVNVQNGYTFQQLVKSVDNLNEKTSKSSASLQYVFKSSLSDAVKTQKVNAAQTTSPLANWGSVEKSTALALTNMSTTNYTREELLKTSSGIDTATSSTSTSSSDARKLSDFMSTMEKSITGDGKTRDSFESWLSKSSKYGITDLESALKEEGLTEANLRQRWNEIESEQAGKALAAEQEREDKFWAAGTNFWETVHPDWQTVMNAYQEKMIVNQENAYALMSMYFEIMSENQSQQIELLTYNNKVADKIFNKEKEFYDGWVDYYVNHTAYSKETLNAYSVAGIKNAEKNESGDAVLALAKALTQNTVDLKDPAVQTNALLSQILIVAEAIMQQNNSTSGVLPTSLAALGLGIVK